MAAPSVTNTFTNGTTADATEVNQNFTDVINGITDGTKDLTCSVFQANGNVTLGNASGDDITITGSLAATLNIKTDGTFDIGSTALGLSLCYFGDAGGNTVGIQAPAIASNFTLDLPGHTVVMPASDGAAKDYIQTDASGAWTFVGGPGITSKTTTYTATTADKVISVATSSGWTLTLYAASGNGGRTLRVIKTSDDVNTLTIDGNGAETIDGSTTILMENRYEEVELICDGSNWSIINRFNHTIKDGSNPAAGAIGAILTATGTVGSPVSNTADKVASVTLTAGNWIILAAGYHGGAGSSTGIILAVSTTEDNVTAGTGGTAKGESLVACGDYAANQAAGGTMVMYRSISASDEFFLNGMPIGGAAAITGTITGIRIS